MSHYISRQNWAEKRPQIFHFEVEVDEEEWGYDERGVYGRLVDPVLTVQVRLPHQCDAWEVTRNYASKDEAIEDLQMFIAAAEDALAALKDLEVKE